MENENKILKQYIPVNCPHCNEQLFVSVSTMMPAISVTTKLDIDNAKNAIKSRLEEITFANEENKKQIINWINSEETLLDFSDIEPLIKQISVEETEKISQSTK